jgi:hypothetical protein
MSCLLAILRIGHVALSRPNISISPSLSLSLSARRSLDLALLQAKTATRVLAEQGFTQLVVHHSQSEPDLTGTHVLLLPCSVSLKWPSSGGRRATIDQRVHSRTTVKALLARAKMAISWGCMDGCVGSLFLFYVEVEGWDVGIWYLVAMFERGFDWGVSSGEVLRMGVGGFDWWHVRRMSLEQTISFGTLV